MAGLVREAAIEALDDAGMTWADIDAVVIGKAPDMFEGVDDARALPRRRARRGRQADDARAHRGLGRRLDRDRRGQARRGRASTSACSRSRSRSSRESNATWGLSVPMPFQAPLVAGAGGYFAPLIRAYMYRSGAPRHIGHLVAVKDRLAALRNPKAHLHLPDIDLKTVEESFLLWDPMRYLERARRPTARWRWCSAARRSPTPRRRPVAWIHGMAMRSEPTMFARPRPGEPAGRARTARRTSTRRPASPTRATTSTAPRSTCRSRGTSRCGSRTSASAPRARAGSSPRPARPRPTATSRGTRRAACSRRTRSARRA